MQTENGWLLKSGQEWVTTHPNSGTPVLTDFWGAHVFDSLASAINYRDSYPNGGYEIRMCEYTIYDPYEE